ncbi:MAG: hypothetical protein GF388_02465 [Candidatus Aegiribacteria sp.]|nr:hypothetical protein [Candidatus Aegiribacteria sp.]
MEKTIQLTGTDKNAFAIIGKCRKALLRSGASAEKIREYTDNATGGNYDNVIETTIRYLEEAGYEVL